MCGGIYARVYSILVCVQCRRKESSRSLSLLLMSFLFPDLGTGLLQRLETLTELSREAETQQQ